MQTRLRAFTSMVLGIVTLFLHFDTTAQTVVSDHENPNLVESQDIETKLFLPKIIQHGLSRKIVLYESDKIRISKESKTNSLIIESKKYSRDVWRIWDIPQSWRNNSHPMAVFSPSSEEVYLGIYDKVQNLASGRVAGKSSSGIDIYHANSDSPDKIDLVLQSLPIGGIDTQIYLGMTDTGITACGDNRCFSRPNDSLGQIEWDNSTIRTKEFVEVSIGNTGISAILREKHDDTIQGYLTDKLSTYSIAQIFQDKAPKICAIESGIPWDIHYDNGYPRYRLANNSLGYAKLFEFDFSRLGVSSILDFGSNNLEGRVAWNSVYYINALLSVLQIRKETSGKYFNFDPSDRIDAEVLELNRHCLSDYPNFRVKRYSIEREPVKFALHLGRINSLLERAESASGKGLTKRCQLNLRKELVSLNSTVEGRSHSTNSILKEYSTLAYKRGWPFWADGSNVPYNYVSGYVEGILAGDSKYLALANTLILPILDNEFLSKEPFPEIWNYWWGTGDTGWKAKDGVSINTPFYKGNSGGKAHISYRTMDAKAITIVEQRNRPNEKSTLVQHFRDLTARGLLLPDMNEKFFGTEEYVDLLHPIAKRYARSAASWELQSQPWALLNLSGYTPE